LRSESLHQTDSSDLINRTHPIVLRIVLRQQLVEQEMFILPQQLR